MSALPKRGWSDFSIGEWARLSDIAMHHEASMRRVYTRAVQTNIKTAENDIRTAITLQLAEVCDTTSRVYGMTFDPGNPIYGETVDRLTADFVRSINSESARREVTRVVPRSLSLSEYRKRTDTYGLDARAAVRIERMRQEGASDLEIDAARQSAIMIRGNLIATTETNRITNQALIALWKANVQSPIEKARRRRPKVEYIGTSRRRIEEQPHKTWMTRRDDKVCNYCDPLDGITARLDAEFDTRYGIFECPPIHPNCRCFMVLG